MPNATSAVVPGKSSDQLFNPLNVLVVDDMAVVRRMVCQMLQHLGVMGDIHEAGDGQEAWDILQQRSYDLIVCDINMPRMNGLDLLRRLRSTTQYQTTPFLMITGEVSEDIVAASAESEVDAYLLKPFKVSSLESRLRAIILHRYHPSWGESLFRQASNLVLKGQPTGALEILEKLAQPPFCKQAKVLNLMGECYLALGDLNEAAACFTQALELNPKYLKGYHGMAAVLESQGNSAAARAYLEEARKLSPLNPERLYRLGQLCLKEGAVLEAKKYLNQCWHIGLHVPEDRRAEVAETFLAAGVEEVAEELFRHALTDAPQDADLHNRLGVSLRRQHKHQLALEAYKNALRLDPLNEKVHFNLGVLYLDLGQNDKALRAFRRALNLRPDFPEAREFLHNHFPQETLPPFLPDLLPF
ncbi:MAG: tetratricopeptide repeat protein [Desulfobaccales bacterium]